MCCRKPISPIYRSSFALQGGRSQTRKHLAHRMILLMHLQLLACAGCRYGELQKVQLSAYVASLRCRTSSDRCRAINLIFVQWLSMKCGTVTPSSTACVCMQAVEAKEGVPLLGDSRTVASVTYQCFFKYYDKLCGMTVCSDPAQFLNSKQACLVGTKWFLYAKAWSSKLVLSVIDTPRLSVGRM